jgi:hypothetical protein
MNPLEWIMKGRFGAAARAGAAFVTVSIIGAIGLVVVAIVLWAASLTPFGLWAGLPVIAAGAIVALALWRQSRAELEAPLQHSASLESREPLSWSGRMLQAGASREPENFEAEVARLPRVKLIGFPASLVPRVHRLVAKEPGTLDADDLKRRFDQAFAAERFDEAERVLSELATMPGQIEWTERKQRLVRQQRARS